MKRNLWREKMTINQYSVRLNESLIEGAEKFRDIYGENLRLTGLNENSKFMYIGEINHTAIILTKDSITPNLMVIGLEELIKDTEKEIVSKGLELNKLGEVKK
jgi:hypothetical protein